MIDVDLGSSTTYIPAPTIDPSDFIAHYGVKGMKWGVRKDRGVQTGRQDSTSGDKPKTSRKKKAAIAAGVVLGGAALVALGVAAQSEKTKRGEAAAAAQIREFGQKSMWDLATELSTPATKPNKPSSPRGRKTKEQAAKDHIRAVGKKSKWEMATSNLPSPKTKTKSTTKYTKRDGRRDTKVYGKKGSARIQKRVAKGQPLSKARKREAARQYGPKAARVSMGINSATRREERERKKR